MDDRVHLRRDIFFQPFDEVLFLETRGSGMGFDDERAILQLRCPLGKDTAQ